jgi:hypothetical protein
LQQDERNKTITGLQQDERNKTITGLQQDERNKTFQIAKNITERPSAVPHTAMRSVVLFNGSTAFSKATSPQSAI